MRRKRLLLTPDELEVPRVLARAAQAAHDVAVRQASFKSTVLDSDVGARCLDAVARIPGAVWACGGGWVFVATCVPNWAGGAEACVGAATGGVTFGAAATFCGGGVTALGGVIDLATARGGSFASLLASVLGGASC